MTCADLKPPMRRANSSRINDTPPAAVSTTDAY
nr:MAG TPA: hypothetical protein [Caudoviricetes sp.]